jgi:hypothetical protein
MLNNTSKWSHARGNEVVPSRWQATSGLLGCCDCACTNDDLRDLGSHPVYRRESRLRSKGDLK